MIKLKTLLQETKNWVFYFSQNNNKITSNNDGETINKYEILRNKFYLEKKHEKIPFDKIVTTQTSKDFDPNFKSHNFDKPPLLIKRNNLYYVADGHYRLLHTAYTGETSIYADVYDITNYDWYFVFKNKKILGMQCH